MPKNALNAGQVAAMLAQAADAVIAAEPELTDADRALGDGDHGIGMKRGMTAAKEKLADSPPDSITAAFSTFGMAMMSTMGGASGAVFGTLFRSGGKALDGRDAFDADALADFLDAGCQGVMTRGGAKPGDKTMIDALHPAAEKAKECRGNSLADAFREAAAAAEAGKEASCQMKATMGRAAALGEKSIGHPDAGAVSVAIILRAMSGFVDDEE